MNCIVCSIVFDSWISVCVHCLNSVGNEKKLEQNISLSVAENEGNILLRMREAFHSVLEFLFFNASYEEF